MERLVRVSKGAEVLGAHIWEKQKIITLNFKLAFLNNYFGTFLKVTLRAFLENFWDILKN